MRQFSAFSMIKHNCEAESEAENVGRFCQEPFWMLVAQDIMSEQHTDCLFNKPVRTLLLRHSLAMIRKFGLNPYRRSLGLHVGIN